MSGKKQKLLSIMRSLDKDYKAGKISKEKYVFFKAKYQDQLNSLDKYEATNRIRSMQGKRPPNLNKKEKAKRRKVDRKKEEKDLVQKYIVNPKKGDKDFKKNKSMDSGTYKLFVVLTLVIAFTIGISVGIFALDFEDMSVVNADAIVLDTSFPDTSNVTVEVEKTNTTTTDNQEDSSEESYVSDQNTEDYSQEQTGESQGDSSSSESGSAETGSGGSESPTTI